MLRLLDGKFDVLVTSDASIAHQQNLAGRGFSIIVLPTNDLAVLKANAAAIRTTLDELTARKEYLIVVIDRGGGRTVRPLVGTEPSRELSPVPPFSSEDVP